MQQSICFQRSVWSPARSLGNAAARRRSTAVACWLQPPQQQSSQSHQPHQQQQQQRQQIAQAQRQDRQQQPPAAAAATALASLPAAALLWALAELPAAAAVEELVGSGPPASSYYVSLGLFVMTVPGLYSLIKRAPAAKIKRKTYTVAGPAAPDAMPLDARARQMFAYFSRYNYEVASRGEVITFVGNYRGSVSQALSLVLYTAVGLASTALVLSITVPSVGNWWYAMCAVAPAAGAYYWKNAERTEEFKVKMVTSDDELTTDIVVEGDDEEIERFWKELGLTEKGKVLVKGILQG